MTKTYELRCKSELARELERNMLESYLGPTDAEIARLKELNTPKVIIDGMFVPSLNMGQEIFLSVIEEHEFAANPAERKAARAKLRRLGYSIQDADIVAARAAIEARRPRTLTELGLNGIISL